MDSDNQLMSLDVARSIFESTDGERMSTDRHYRESLRYYRNKNDIVIKTNGKSKADNEKKENEKTDPLHDHDSRVSSNFQQLLVDQKASYVGGTPPTIDVESKADNSKIEDTLGDGWQSTLYKLIVDASLAGTSWLHVWNDDDGFHYAEVPPFEVTPIYKNSLTHELLAVRRTYDQLDPTDGKVYTYNEYWTQDSATFFRQPQGEDYDTMVYNQSVAVVDSVNDEAMDNTATFKHGFKGVPFIPFRNNNDERPDLYKYKGLIDVYDLVYNGFVNDVEDVQQVILILTNYEGTNLEQFKDNLRKYKAANFESTSADDRSGLDKLTIDIPVDARTKLLDMTFKNIFYQGQGVNPDELSLGTNLSGTAIKMLYGQLELKAQQIESEFTPSVAQLVRFILGKDNTYKITQTWTRTSIQNDSEQADIVAKLASVSSKEAVAKHNPIADDPDQELKDLQKDQDDADERQAAKPDPFANPAALQAAQQGQDNQQQDNKDNPAGDDSKPVADD